MKMITWVIIIGFGFFGILINIIKKKAMITFAESYGNITLANVFKFATWLALFQNPLAILVLGLGFMSWGIGMWLMQLENMSTIIMLMYGLGIPFMILNIFAGMVFFNDTFTFNQWVGVGIVMIAGTISIPGVYLIGGGKLW